MEYNFSDEEMNLIKAGLSSINSKESAELLKKIEIEMGIKAEDNHKMLHNFRGEEKEFEVVVVANTSDDKLEEYMFDYEDTNEMFYDDEEQAYTILKDYNGWGDTVAINQDDWEEWLSNRDDEEEED